MSDITSEPYATDILIVGAGLSGLTTAHEIMKQYKPPVSITLLEARGRHGGRILNAPITPTDMGGAWCWPGSTPHVDELIANEGLTMFTQPRGSEQVEGVRMNGGMQCLPDSLLRKLSATGNVHFEYDTAVEGIRVEGNEVQVLAKTTKEDLIENRTFAATNVVIAIPPRLAQEIKFSPKLPPRRLAAMRATPTWMAHTGKVAILYDTAWWIHSGLSHTFRVPRGPIQQFFDGSDKDFDHPAIGGFIGMNVPHNDSVLDKAIREQMQQLFGSDKPEPTQVLVTRWYAEKFTAHTLDTTGSGEHPRPNPLLQSSENGDKVIFAGSETALLNPGLLDGAVEAGKRAAKHVVHLLRNNESLL
eukprot:CFRG3750T1